MSSIKFTHIGSDGVELTLWEKKPRKNAIAKADAYYDELRKSHIAIFPKMRNSNGVSLEWAIKGNKGLASAYAEIDSISLAGRPQLFVVTLLALIKATKKYGLVPSGFIPYQCRPAFVAGVFHIEEEGVQLVEVNTRGKIKNYYYPAEEFGQEFDPLDKKYLASEK